MTTIQPVLLGNIIDSKRPVLPYWKHVTDAMCSESHAHPRGQFIFSNNGITRVITKQGVYLVPSSQAFWCPPNHEHMLIFPGSVDISNLFIDPKWAEALPRTQQVFDVSPLLRELILKAVQIGTEYNPKTKEHRLMEVIMDEISLLKASPLTLPWTEQNQLQKIMSAMLEDPTNNQNIEHWASFSHTTTRTLARLFKKEVNMTFTEWRMQVRLFYALEQLHKGGTTVTTIALNLGYSTPSAFIAAFRKALGKSPLEYIFNAKA
jgi:AraC-like DNA-binding protein